MPLDQISRKNCDYLLIHQCKFVLGGAKESSDSDGSFQYP